VWKLSDFTTGSRADAFRQSSVLPGESCGNASLLPFRGLLLQETDRAGRWTVPWSLLGSLRNWEFRGPGPACSDFVTARGTIPQMWSVLLESSAFSVVQKD